MQLPMLSCVAGLLATLSPAQDAPTPKPPERADWSIPIHRAPGSDEIWVSRPTFKASFHDGFTFYPVLGPDAPDHKPWRWETVAVSDIEVAATAATQHRVGDWRYEFRRAGITEAYDVTKTGVVQSFVVHQRPAGGDLVIVGRAVTELRPAFATAQSNNATVFADAGGLARIDFAHPVARDDRGVSRTVRVRTSGDRVTLTVDGAWLASAALPVTLSSTITNGGPTPSAALDVASISTAIYTDARTETTVISAARQVTTTDWDVAAGRTHINEAGGVTFDGIFSDTTTRNTPRIATGFVSAANRWVLAVERGAISAGNRQTDLMIYLHDRTTGSTNGGISRILRPVTDDVYRYPAVGGTYIGTSGDEALVVFQADRTTTGQDTTSSSVRGISMNARTAQFGAPFDISIVGSDNDRPRVNVQRSNREPWIVVWQRRAFRPNPLPWDIAGRLVNHDGAVGVSATLGTNTNPIPHEVRPQVAGFGGRYLVAFTRSSEIDSAHGDGIAARRVDWPVTRNSPTIGDPSPIFAGGGTRLGGVAFDSETASHWAVTYRVPGAGTSAFARLGYTGGVVQTVDGLAEREGDVAFSGRDAGFLVVSRTATGTDPVRVDHDSDVGTTTYGVSCGGFISAGSPYAGHENWQINLALASSTAVGNNAVLLIGLQRIDAPLDSIGAIGCRLGVDPLLTKSAVINLFQASSTLIALPDRDPFLGDLLAQWAYLDFAAPGGLRLSNAIEARVRP